jgi:hypothetical protein
MIGTAMVTMATELFCLNKLLENLRYFHVVFLSVGLRVKRFNLTIRDTNSKCCSNFGITKFFLKNYFFLQLSKKRDIYASLSSRKVCHF